MRERRALASCPWCDWRVTVKALTLAEVVEAGRSAIEAHNAEAGHRVKPGTKPRRGYYQGRPIS